MYLNVFETHCQITIRTVMMMRMCECGCVNARTNLEAQRLTIFTCETCQHAHGRDEKCETVRKYGIDEVCSRLLQAAASCSNL